MQLFGSKRPCTGAAAGLTEIKCFSSPSVAGATISKRRNCLFRLKKPIRPVPALPAYAYQEASSLVLASSEMRLSGSVPGNPLPLSKDRLPGDRTGTALEDLIERAVTRALERTGLAGGKPKKGAP